MVFLLQGGIMQTQIMAELIMPFGIGFIIGIVLFVVLEMEKFVARRLFPGIIHHAAPACRNHKETTP
jgi:hypothetical protein